MDDGTNQRSDEMLSLSEEAADWLLRLSENPDDRCLMAAFDEWLGRSPAHRSAWDRTRKAWSLMGHVPPAFREVWDEGQPVARKTIPAPARHREPDGLSVWMIGLAACVALVVVPMALIRTTADYTTATGENRTIMLSDGSTVQLGGDSAIEVDFAPGHREVTVLAGEAFFDVVHAEDKPFIVEAGGAKVEVLGTAFDVRLTPETTDVALARGSVKASFGMGERQTRATLAPGQMLAIDRDTGAMKLSTVATEDIGAWRDGRLYVSDETIGSVVRQLRRYHSAWIAIPDPALARQRVTGVYDLRDLDRALRALVAPYGGIIREATPWLRVITRI
jgi:transmembrane sensor